MLGCSPNTTPFLKQSPSLGIRSSDGQQFAGVLVVYKKDGTNKVSHLVGSVNHVLHHLLVVSILLGHLVNPQTKLPSPLVMHVIVLNKVSCYNIYSLSNAHDWTSHNKIASGSTFSAGIVFSDSRCGRRDWQRIGPDSLRGLGSHVLVFFCCDRNR